MLISELHSISILLFNLASTTYLGISFYNLIIMTSLITAVFCALLFVAYFEEYNALQLDQLTGKMRRTRRPIPLNRKVQSLAFIHEIPLHKPLCGGALVTEQNCFAAILADGFCISDQTVLSSLRVELNIYDRPANPSFFLVIRKLNLARDNFNLVLLLLDRKVNEDYETVYPFMYPTKGPKRGNEGDLVGWDENWNIIERNFIIEHVKPYEIQIALEGSLNTPIDQRSGQLLFIDGFLVAITTVSQNPSGNLFHVDIYLIRRYIIRLMNEYKEWWERNESTVQNNPFMKSEKQIRLWRRDMNFRARDGH